MERPDQTRRPGLWIDVSLYRLSRGGFDASNRRERGNDRSRCCACSGGRQIQNYSPGEMKLQTSNSKLQRNSKHQAPKLVFMKTRTIGLLFSCIVLTACKTSKYSISNFSYHEPGRVGYPTAVSSDAAFQYRGELSEFDVLGITRGEVASESEINRALDHAKRVKLRPNSSILLIQSGAVFP